MTRPDASTAPVRRTDAMAAGHSDGRLRRSHIALFRGVHLNRATSVTLEVRIEAALLVATPGSYVSHHTAAALWGAIVPAHPDIHVSSPRNRTRREGITAHRTKEVQDVIRFQKFRVTSPVQTFLDLAHHLTLVDLVVLGDSLVRRRRTTPEQLVSATRRHRGPYSLLARKAAALVRTGVDSAMETRLRLLIVLAGLPEPDGRQHAESEEQWLTDTGKHAREDHPGHAPGRYAGAPAEGRVVRSLPRQAGRPGRAGLTRREVRHGALSCLAVSQRR